ncbi:hypothetical protein NPIL_322911 [Nephila pilipes]|uniref:Uncharacterized protein n=1 Tax=Nephila pilipes TaxID=299642 RepID=A0A8X6R551_NEPPI|nr:hypothetical protein NPIL_322911 [Nephila pilipes]
MIKTRCLTTEKATSSFESLSLDCSDSPAQSSTDQELLIDYPPVVSLFDLQNAVNVDSRSDEDLEVQNAPRVWKKRNATMVIPIFPLN